MNQEKMNSPPLPPPPQRSSSSLKEFDWSRSDDLAKGDYRRPPPTTQEILYRLFLRKKIDLSNCRRVAHGRYSKIVTAKAIKDDDKTVPIAMKVINTSKVSLPYMVNFLTKELYHWRQLRHPHVLALLGQYEILHYMFLTMEYAAKGDMERYIAVYGRVKETQLYCWMMQIIAGVGYMHEQFLPHQRLEPKNILIDEWDQLKVFNFGVNDDDESTTTTTVEGGPGYYGPGYYRLGYRAPEVLEKTPNYDVFKADVWSLGCCMFYMATGKRPFAEDWHLPTVVNNQRLRLYAHEPEVSDHCRRSLDALLTFDPDFRPMMANSICLPFFH